MDDARIGGSCFVLLFVCFFRSVTSSMASVVDLHRRVCIPTMAILKKQTTNTNQKLDDDVQIVRLNRIY